MIYSVNNSYFYYENNYVCINYYFNYIVDIIKNILLNNPQLNLNILFSSNNKFKNLNFNNNNKLIKIGLNIEHTLVKKGGRGVDNVVFGNILDENKEPYLVRIVNYEDLKKTDIVIEYSQPNICNINSISNCLSNKMVYISSSIYNFNFIKNNRNITTLTTFIDINQPRRRNLLNNINRINTKHINVDNCFDLNSLKNLYRNTKILLNIHQTDHHHTFEELRVLPALLCGVITICEYSPLNELIPYNDYIIWSSYDKIIDKTLEVINNYDYYYDLIFKQEKKISINDLKNIDYETLKKKFLEL
jgi:hypothetical protein